MFLELFYRIFYVVISFIFYIFIFYNFFNEILFILTCVFLSDVGYLSYSGLLDLFLLSLDLSFNLTLLFILFHTIVHCLFYFIGGLKKFENNIILFFILLLLVIYLFLIYNVFFINAIWDFIKIFNFISSSNVFEIFLELNIYNLVYSLLSFIYYFLFSLSSPLLYITLIFFNFIKYNSIVRFRKIFYLVLIFILLNFVQLEFYLILILFIIFVYFELFIFYIYVLKNK